MDTIFQQIADWLKEMLVGGIMNSLTVIFDVVNQQVGNVATQVGTTPASFSPGVFSMIRGVSESVIVPIAGLILTFIACYELIQLTSTIIIWQILRHGSSSSGSSRPL